jgi:hypothetical protein
VVKAHFTRNRPCSEFAPLSNAARKRPLPHEEPSRGQILVRDGFLCVAALHFTKGGSDARFGVMAPYPSPYPKFAKMPRYEAQSGLSGPRQIQEANAHELVIIIDSIQ